MRLLRERFSIARALHLKRARPATSPCAGAPAQTRGIKSVHAALFRQMTGQRPQIALSVDHSSRPKTSGASSLAPKFRLAAQKMRRPVRLLLRVPASRRQRPAIRRRDHVRRRIQQFAGRLGASVMSAAFDPGQFGMAADRSGGVHGASSRTNGAGLRRKSRVSASTTRRRACRRARFSFSSARARFAFDGNHSAPAAPVAPSCRPARRTDRSRSPAHIAQKPDRQGRRRILHPPIAFGKTRQAHRRARHRASADVAEKRQRIGMRAQSACSSFARCRAAAAKMRRRDGARRVLAIASHQRCQSQSGVFRRAASCASIASLPSRATRRSTR